MNQEPNGESKHFMVLYSLYIYRKLVEGKISLSIIMVYNLNKNI